VIGFLEHHPIELRCGALVVWDGVGGIAHTNLGVDRDGVVFGAEDVGRWNVEVGGVSIWGPTGAMAVSVGVDMGLEGRNEVAMTKGYLRGEGGKMMREEGARPGRTVSRSCAFLDSRQGLRLQSRWLSDCRKLPSG
jgi:hypothetical protein